MFESIIDPTINGYRLYTSVIHQHPITGVLHGIFMPIACIGFFFCIKAAFDVKVARRLLEVIVFCMTAGWITHEPLYGLITAFAYLALISWSLTTEKSNMPIGLAMMAVSIGVMEFIGHWYLEGHESNLRHFLNSVYHTPLYGTVSLLTFRHIIT